MATRRTSKSKAVAKWDEELARRAQIAADAEAAAGGGQFFSTRGGILSWQDAPLPNNEMAVIILDTIFENIFYEGDYDPDVQQGPTCFALNKVEKDLEPHIIVKEAGYAQSLEGCANCEHNEWGSADTGRGKACRNTRRLALIGAGNLDRSGELEELESAEFLETTTIGYLKLPVTSVKGYATFVKQLAGTLKRPPFGVVTKVKIVPDAKSSFRILFEPLAKLPDDIMGTIVTRVDEASQIIDFPYPMDDVDEPQPVKPKAKAKAKSKARPKAKAKAKSKAPSRRY